MPITQLTDIVQFPINISEYIDQNSIETNAFWQSGIVSQDVDARTQALLDAGGFEVLFPFWNDLTGSAQILQEGTNLTVGKIGTGMGKAPVLERGEVWGSTDLVSDFLGQDPMKRIADRVSAFWSRHYSATLLSTMAGAIGAVAANVLDISALSGAAALFDADSFIDAKFLLGDRAEKLTAIAVHSKTLALMEKQNLITYIPPVDALSKKLAFYGDLRVIVDDTMTYNAGTGVYTSYLFAAGSVLFAEGGVKVPQAVERNELINGGQEYLVSRKRFIFVPSGISWTGTPAAQTPPNATNTELATIGNWTRKYDQKNIGIVKFVHKIA